MWQTQHLITLLEGVGTTRRGDTVRLQRSHWVSQLARI